MHKLKSIKPSTLLMVLAILAIASVSFAFVAPSNNLALGYDFFDFANKMATGAPGFAIGVGGVCLAGFFLFQQKVMPACGTLFGVIAILKATNIVTSLGSII